MVNKIKEVIEVRTPVSELRIGMHVVRLDRPWLETSFLMQGFVIQDDNDIRALQAQCEYVFIEGTVQVTQAAAPKPEEKKGFFSKLFDTKPKKEAAPDKPSADGHVTVNAAQEAPLRPPSPGEKITYIKKVSVGKEFKQAYNAFETARDLAKNIMEGVRLGRTLDMNHCKAVVDECVDSILRNNDALMLLTKLKERDEYTAEHSMNVCILSATFARHLGHTEDEIRTIGLCGLLHDIGKSKIPLEVLNKEGALSEEEFHLMKQHPTLGRNQLMSVSGSVRISVDVAFSHHERPDGKGYPRSLQAHQIPYYAKIVAITDAYDAITSNRCYDKGRASKTALDIIYTNRGKQFDDELAIEFVRCIGIFPPGAIVEMTSGEVGIVINSDIQHKLRPTIELLLDENKQRRMPHVVNLREGALDPKGEKYIIKQELPDGAFGINLREEIDKGLVLSPVKIEDNEDFLDNLVGSRD